MIEFHYNDIPHVIFVNQMSCFVTNPLFKFFTVGQIRCGKRAVTATNFHGRMWTRTSYLF